MKRHRYAKIKELVQSRVIETQEELAQALQEEGIDVTQATVSRDIKELMLIKVPTTDGRYRYALSPDENVLISRNRMVRVFQDAITKIDYSGNLIVVSTLPGNANAVASVIDHSHWENIIGTIAGDDTLLLVVKPEKAVTKVIKEINSLMKD